MFAKCHLQLYYSTPKEKKSAGIYALKSPLTQSALPFSPISHVIIHMTDMLMHGLIQNNAHCKVYLTLTGNIPYVTGQEKNSATHCVMQLFFQSNFRQ